MNLKQLAWGKRVSKEFRDEIANICAGFGWTEQHANWLMACIAFESGETFSPSIKNAAGSGATGLIQFMPSTALAMGTSVAQLATMAPEQQLQYVRAYFRPYARKIKTLPDMYMAILLPKMVGAGPHAVLFNRGVAYRQNSGLDSNKDGMVTKQEASAKVQAKLLRGLQPGNVWEV